MHSAESATAATLGETTLSLGDLLAHLHRHMRLVPLVREALIERFLAHRAAAAGLSVSTAELQHSANQFRARHGLHAAQAMHDWLTRQHLSVDDFEAGLERALLIAKFQDHVTRPHVAEHFAAHGDDYATVSMRRILVSSEDLARELLHQLQDEGKDFAALAREHSLHASRADGGAAGWMRRRDLPAAVAAAAFAASPGQVAGPLAAPDGFHLIQVEAIRPPVLDAHTTALIRRDLFDAWLADQLRAAPLAMPILKNGFVDTRV